MKHASRAPEARITAGIHPRAASHARTAEEARSAGALAALAALALGGLGSCSDTSAGAAEAGGGGSQALAVEEGETVAILELAAPTASPFLLRGTIPLPPGTWWPEAGATPFRIAWRESDSVAAQVEVVSRYPAEEDGADVVEVLARVERPAGASPGDRVRYAVLWQPSATGALLADPAVEALFDTPRSIVAETRDVFGHAYTADLLGDARVGQDSARTLRDGPAALEVATHEVLVPETPVAGDQGTLEHMMGVHTYATRVAGEPWFLLDLRVHNASSGEDESDPLDDPLGKLYFRSFELRVPYGWTLLGAIDDPFFGEPWDDDRGRAWPIVAPLAGGKLHLLPPLGQFHRRLAVVRVGHEQRALSALRREGLAFARPGEAHDGRQFWSWWNPETARYFPQRQRLPELDVLDSAALRAQDEQRLAWYSAQVAGGTTGHYPVETAGLGWAHPWGVSDGGMQGGDEIVLFDGVATAWSASNAGVRFLELQHRMYTDRQRNVLFDADGLPTDVSHWTYTNAQGTFLPVWWYNAPMLWASDPFGITTAPAFQAEAVAAQGLEPPYEDALLGYDPVDEAHLVRYTHAAKALVWLANDTVAKEDLRAQAEGIRFAFATVPQDPWGGTISTGVLSFENFVATHPGEGLPFGRGEAWGLDALNAAYSTQDEAFRAAVRPLFERLIDVVEEGQAGCSGIIQATPLYNVFDAQYRCRQSIEAAITENALVGLRESAWKGLDAQRTAQVDSVLERSLRSMISPLVWSSEYGGPQAMIAVGLIDQEAAPFCNWIPADGTYGYADHYQIWTSFSYGYRLTGDPAFLERAEEALGGGDLLAELLAGAHDNLGNKAGLIALAQELAAASP